MKRGDIYFADLNPTVGTEIQKIRPVVIVSNNANNKMASTLTVVPITSNTNKVYRFEVLLPEKMTGLAKQSKAQCQQIRTLSKLRFNKDKAGQINSKLLSQIDAALKLHLDLI